MANPLFVGFVIVATTALTLLVLNTLMVPETTYVFETIKPEIISYYGR